MRRVVLVLVSVVGACSVPFAAEDRRSDDVSARVVCEVPREVPSVVCGLRTCEGALPVCCLGSNGRAECIARDVQCPDLAWTTDHLECDGTEDCPPALVCCRGYSARSETTTATCRTSCLGTVLSRLVCRSECECPVGASCIDGSCRSPDAP